MTVGLWIAAIVAGTMYAGLLLAYGWGVYEDFRDRDIDAAGENLRCFVMLLLFGGIALHLLGV